MRRIILYALSACTIVASFAMSCRDKKPSPTPVVTDYGQFPEAVGKIIVGKCATAGCHNAASYLNCAGLLLDSWAHLFDGGGSGTSLIRGAAGLGAAPGTGADGGGRIGLGGRPV